jgi:Mrp family chromosome partitioning ATPase
VQKFMICAVTAKQIGQKKIEKIINLRRKNMLTSDQVNILGNILNTTFGKSSSKGGDRSITGSLSGDTLVLKFLTIVQFASNQSLRDQTNEIEKESVKILADYVKSIKKDFKEAAGVALKLKDESSSDNVEVIAGSIHAQRKLAYYRRKHIVKIKE